VFSSEFQSSLKSIDFFQFYSTRRPGFFSQFIENIKQEMDKSKEMKDNLKKFREEAQKLEESDALKMARKKFNTVESEASKSGDVFKERLGSLREKVSDALDEASKTDLGKKASQFGRIKCITVSSK
jgi:mitochondrial import inner membrane translocase subunit TIM44